MAQIEADALYPLNEVVKRKMIPGVKGYLTLYNMVTVKNDAGKRVPATQTTQKVIKPEAQGRPGAKLSRLYVRGAEVIKFLKIHNLI